MRVIETYILTYAILTLASGLFLMSIRIGQIEIYYAVYLIEFLVLTQLAASFRRGLERQLRPIVIVFLFGFAYIIFERVLSILT